jgi:hypothetical protein
MDNGSYHSVIAAKAEWRGLQEGKSNMTQTKLEMK